jgi:ABC-type uncharacterized transport system auxiliary subunit
MKIKIIILLSISFLLTQCFNLREEYPEIHYYKLSQEKGMFQDMGIGKIDGTLQIRDFSVSDEIDTDHFLAIWDETKVQRYYYHRWIANCGDLVTNFLMTRYNALRVFSGGAVSPGSMIVPDYILEGQLIDMIAHNSKDDKKSNYVYISMRISLLKKQYLSTDKTILLNKVFTVKSPRESSSVKTIAPAFSSAMSQIADQMLIEIQKTIFEDRLSKED